MSEFSFHKNVSASEGVINFLCDVSEFSFHKNVSASEGVINFFITYLAGVGRGRRKNI